ncbi:riboflavine-aldehyde-forming enzyme [Xylaria sp. CBS 124048]|nr:riboflavine-aldehyde-forming enzyme [Xylaria sp. CBS 124048]
MFSLTQIIVALTLAVGPAFAGSAASGDMTYFNPGLGSCGQTNGPNDAIVAMSPADVVGKCGKSIKINYQGKTATAKVVDTCPSCATGSIDVSPSVFSSLAPLDLGRVKVTWVWV